MRDIKSPLRYPGGKTKAIPKIIKYLPDQFSEYREPFVGGGSLFIYLKQKYPQLRIWINDLNYDLICFWQCVQTSINQLVEEIWKIKNSKTNGRELFEELTSSNLQDFSDFERAVRFFILNRITFSGTVDCGGFSQKAFEARFTNSSIERLFSLKGLLDGALITNLDYGDVINEAGKNVFIFLDPPYLAATNSRLYGKRGDLHLSFSHNLFATQLERCHHKWLITYDDSSEIRKNFQFAYIYAWEMQYGMNNYMQEKAAKGKELFITNYKVSPEEIQQLSINFG